MPKLHLVTHGICPYGQRVIIVLLEKKTPFECTYIDLENRPDWFEKTSPLGKVPLLKVDDDVIFESAVICEYLDEIITPQLHPTDPLSRAHHRGWMEFGSAILGSLRAFNMAKDEEGMKAAANELKSRFKTLETVLVDGPYFSGDSFTLVDVVFGPVFRYFDLYDSIADWGFFTDTPKVSAWRLALKNRPSVINAVDAEYTHNLKKMIHNHHSELSRMLAIKGI